MCRLNISWWRGLQRRLVFLGVICLRRGQLHISNFQFVIFNYFFLLLLKSSRCNSSI